MKILNPRSTKYDPMCLCQQRVSSYVFVIVILKVIIVVMTIIIFMTIIINKTIIILMMTRQAQGSGCMNWMIKASLTVRMILVLNLASSWKNTHCVLFPQGRL